LQQRTPARSRGRSHLRDDFVTSRGPLARDRKGSGRRRQRRVRGADADDCGHGHDQGRDGVPDRAHHAAANEYRIVLAAMPLPASPMETKTGAARPGTLTRSNKTL